MKYYIDNLKRIQTASNLAYRISRPQGAQETETDTTSQAFGYIKHPTEDLYAATVDENMTLPIHEFIRTALNTENDTSVSPYFDGFFNSQEEADAKKALITEAELVEVTDEEGNVSTVSHLRARLNIVDILPDEWVETSYADLESSGWFVDLES